MPIDQININTEEIDEILGKTPNKIIRWGVSAIFGIVMVLLIGSWFFKYPDFITSTIEITTLNPPADVVVKTSGKIESIYVKNKETVDKQQVLANIETPAKYADIQTLSIFLDSTRHVFSETDTIPFSNVKIREGLELGEMQASFSLFVSALNSYTNHVQLAYYDKKIKAIEQQIKDYRLYYEYTNEQKGTVLLDLEIAGKDFQRHKQLFENQTIAEAELEKAQSRYLSKKYAYENIRNSLATINIEISQLESNVIDLQLQNQQQNEKLLLGLAEAYNNLTARLDIWKQRYLLRSPVNGVCIFTKYWSRNQNVIEGEKVMTVIPNNAESIIGKLLLPVSGAGKVKTGQTVNIRLLNYPYMEFGTLQGKVHTISSVPNEDFYYVEVSIPTGMITSYGIKIDFSPKMQGTAEIITKDIRLLQRILRPIKSILTERVKK